MPHTSVKGQVLIDLVAEFAEPSLEEEAETQDMDEKLVSAISLQGPICWKVYVDGAVNQRGSEVGLILISPKRITIDKSLRLGFSATNNEAEYEALWRDVHGSKTRQKSSKHVLGLKPSRWPSEWRIRSKRRKNARMLRPN